MTCNDKIDRIEKMLNDFIQIAQSTSGTYYYRGYTDGLRVALSILKEGGPQDD